MTAVRKNRLLLIVMLFSVAYGQALNETVSFQEHLNSSALHYADIFQYSAILNVASTDFYHWRVSIHNPGDYRLNSWRLYLDDYRIKPLIYGEMFLNQASVAWLSVDSIDIIGSPQLISGNYADAGAIRIGTRKPRQGFNAAGSILLANESGDPGPYKYTEYHSPNVDKIGHDNSSVLEYGFQSGWVRLALYLQQHTFTDTAVCERIRTTTKNWPGTNKIAGSLDFRCDGRRWRHSFLSAWSTNEPTFLFMDIFRQEFPVRYNYFQSSYSGIRKDNFRWYLDYNRNDVRRTADAFQSLPPYIHHSLDLKAETVVTNSNLLRLTCQLTSDRFDLSDDYSDCDFLCQQVNGELRLDHPSGGGKIVASLIYFQNRLATKLAIQNSWSIWRDNILYSHLSMSQRHLNLNPYFQFWNGPGKQIIEEHDILLPVYPEYYSIYSGSVGLQRALFAGISANLNIYLRVNTNEWWGRESTPSVDWNDRTYGGLLMRLITPPGRRVNGTVSANFRMADNDPLNEKPIIKVISRLTFQPDRNFSLFLNGVYQSAEQWDLADDDAEFRALSILPARVWFESGFNKWCWQRRLLIRVVIQNIDNGSLQYHPLGMNREISMIAGAYFWLKGH